MNCPEYSIVTGRFYRAGRRIGKVDSSNGYAAVRFNGKKMHGHRVAWYLVTGSWPTEVDHVDGVRANNAWHNLRDVGRSVNQQNMKCAYASNTTGYLGVSPYRGKYRATITTAGKQAVVGYYTTPEAAHLAYVKAKRAVHEGNTL